MRLVSPVFAKEMVTLSRRKRHFFVRGLLLAVLLAAIAISWIDGVQSFRYTGFADTSYLGHELFWVLAISQLIAVIVLMPTLTAPVIATEKERDTLGLLLMSNLRHHSILLDKLLSRFALVGLLLLSCLPVFFALLVFGGITPDQIATAYLSILGTMLFCSGIGLFFSTVMNRMHTALIASFSTIIGYVLVLYVLDEELHVIPLGPEYFLPIMDGLDSASFFLLLSALVFFVLLLLSIALLPKQSGVRERHFLKRLFRRLNTFFHKINFTGVVLFDESQSIGENAILWKETHKHFFSSRIFLVRSTYVTIVFSLIVLATTQMWDVLASMVGMGGMIFLIMIAIVASSTAFTLEREKNSFEILMSSPLTAQSIVVAKFIGVLRMMLPVVVCMAIWSIVLNCIGSGWWSGYSYSIWGEFEMIGYDPRVFVIIVSQIPMIVAIGLYSSTKRRRAGTAILQTFLICVVWSLIPMVLVLLDEFDWVYFESETMDAIASGVPFFSALMIMEEGFNVAMCLLAIPCWILLLKILVGRFDKMIGRQ